jgi:hypothetical protein
MLSGRSNTLGNVSAPVEEAGRVIGRRALIGVAHGDRGALDWQVEEILHASMNHRMVG